MAHGMKKENLGDFAPGNPFVDMRLIEEWDALEKELVRLGVDLSRRSVHEGKTHPKERQRISIRHF